MSLQTLKKAIEDKMALKLNVAMFDGDGDDQGGDDNSGGNNGGDGKDNENNGGDDSDSGSDDGSGSDDSDAGDDEWKPKTFDTKEEYEAEFGKRAKRERKKFAKELGIGDDFDKDAYDAFLKKQESEKSELQKQTERNQKLEEENKKLKAKEAQRANEKQAVKLDFDPKQVDDVLDLATAKAKREDKAVGDVLKEMAKDDKYKHLKKDGATDRNRGRETSRETKSTKSGYKPKRKF